MYFKTQTLVNVEAHKSLALCCFWKSGKITVEEWLRACLVMVTSSGMVVGSTTIGLKVKTMVRLDTGEGIS